MRLALDQIFAGNVVDMLAEILPQLARGLQPLLVGLGVFQRGRRLQREFGVDDEMPVIRHVDAAIRARIIRQRELEFIGALRQPVGDDRFHAALAEGAAALLVVENLLQRRHRRGQIGDVLLRRVDHGEPRVQLLQMIGGVLGRGLHRLAEVLRHRVEPRVHGLLQLRMRILQPAAHGIEPRIEFAQPLLGRGVGAGARGRVSHAISDAGGDATASKQDEQSRRRFPACGLLP